MKKLLATLSMVVAALGLAAAPAAAHPPQQSGLVNVYVDDVTVQIPVSVALSLCDVNVAVLVDTFEDDAAQCNTDGGSIALTEMGENGKSPVQQGLVNVALTDVTAQVPVSVAANVCDIDVAVLVSDFDDAAAQCDSNADSIASLLPPV